MKSTERWGTKSRPSGEGLVKVFRPEEVQPYKSYRFPSNDIFKVGKEFVEEGKCTKRGCRKKHYMSIPVD